MSNYEATRYNFSAASLGGVQGVNTGIIVPWSSTSVPTGFLECDGTNVSRSTYATLFAIVGTVYGAGDGSSTFGLPDLRNNVPLGKSNNKTMASTGGADTVACTGTCSVAGAAANATLSTAQLAAHTHLKGYNTGGYAIGSYALYGVYRTPGASGSTGGGTAHGHNLTINGATFTGSATSVLQPYVSVLYIIKT